MASVNKVILIGNLGKDPETTNFEKGSVTRLALATNENYKDKSGEWQSKTDWHNVVCWRMLSERAEKQLKKGMQIYVEGKLRNNSYTDSDGNTRYTTDVEASNFYILGPRNQDGSSGSTETPASSNFNNNKGKPSEVVAEGGDDDLPF